MIESPKTASRCHCCCDGADARYRDAVSGLRAAASAAELKFGHWLSGEEKTFPEWAALRAAILRLDAAQADLGKAGAS